MKKISEIIGDAKTIGITGHTKPDGDCIGSCMGIFNYIVKNFPEVDVKVYLEEFVDKFRLIKNTDKVITTGYDRTVFDLFICMDAADEERLGINKEYFKNAKRTVCIDHHISNQGYADYNYILPEASSASEVLFDILDEDKIDKDIAEPIYMGIAHDSGCFRYRNTSPKTMTIAAKMMEKGIDISEILEETYYNKTFEQKQITARVMLDSSRIMDNKCIVGYVTNEMMEQYNVTVKDLDAIVGNLRSIEGIECAIFLYQTDKDAYKVSMRSQNYVNVSEIAVKFGGGGHIRAAGFNATGNADDIIKSVVAEVEKQM